MEGFMLPTRHTKFARGTKSDFQTCYKIFSKNKKGKKPESRGKSMDNTKIAKLHNKVFSTPKGSREREQAINSLSDSERKAVFKLEEDYMLGRITRKEIAEMAQKENETMTYEQFVKKSESDEKGVMRELSQFAMKSPELYQQYREKWQAEISKQQRLHNRRLTENTFKNKPFSNR